jgi:poly(hydroxyalkanoate) depolymerase family esterase
MNDTFQSLMREATRLTQSGRLTEATAVIQRAMAGAKVPPQQHAPVDAVPLIAAEVFEGCVREVQDDVEAFAEDHPAQPSASEKAAAPTERVTEKSTESLTETFSETFTETFTEGEFIRSTQRHRYKLFTPSHRALSGPLPLVVMLHGCTQDPDDFALGTGMNDAARLADGSQGFYVLYPSQPRNVNAQGCWNWFERAHQRRGQGEPAWIAELTQQVISTHPIDPQRVYIAGLSAGGAMAAVVAAAYPDVFAAVGVHSGLPVGAASNLTQALTAMKRGSSNAVAHPATSVPTIVFHGDQDRTVHAVNAQALIAASTAGSDVGVQTEQGQSAFGKKFTRSVYASAAHIQAEHWQLHGAPHAWSGGSAQGSYTDPRGVNATQEMLRFFRLHSLSRP